MAFTRIYQPTTFVINQNCRLDEKASHHIARVLRMYVGDKLTVFNGEGGEYNAVITKIDKKGVDVQIIDFLLRDAESPLDIYLAQGIARGEKMDFIVQKAVELGVKKIIPIITERCNVRLNQEREDKRLQHWQSVIISACEQSGRNILPTILPPMTLMEWLPQITADVNFVLAPAAPDKLPELTFSKHKSVAILIGPEGGLSVEEIELAKQHGFLGLNLGPRILRTETAPLAAITIFQCLYGDMQ